MLNLEIHKIIVDFYLKEAKTHIGECIELHEIMESSKVAFIDIIKNSSRVLWVILRNSIQLSSYDLIGDLSSHAVKIAQRFDNKVSKVAS